MNTHLLKIVALFKAIGRQIYQLFMELPPYKRVIAVVGALAILLLAYQILPGKKVVEEVGNVKRGVSLESVYNLSNRINSVPLVGQVTSVNEATIRAESSGRLTRVYRKLGDRVSAGQVIAEFENSGERAAVLQAQGQYEATKAARDIALINTQNTTTGIADVKTNTINTINSTFATLDDIVRSKTDVAFVDARTDSPKLKLLIPDSILQSKIENDRKEIEKILVERFTRNLNLTLDTDLAAELTKVQAETQIVKNYLDLLGNAYVKALPDQNFSQATIDGQKSVIGGVRSTVAGTIATLSGSKTALQNSLASLEIAGRTTGDKNPNTASVDAQVKTAEGGYLAALSRLEKTIVRSPISGTINSLSFDTGDFVGQTTQVAVVSNNGALEVVTFITSEDLNRVKAGAEVLINNKTKGVVTRLASAIDPVTKKIEVRIGITDESAQLVNGQSVRVEIARANTQATPTTVAQVKIPLSAVKITPREVYVFTVDSTSSLVSVPVELGTLLGEEVEIKTGLSPDMQIVKDARGLKPGDVVTINQ
jgi:RND family efflux transporter MFP subunit